MLRVYITLLATASAAVITIPWPTPSKTPLNVTLGYSTVKSTGTRFNWYAASLDDLSRFSVQLPATGCAALQKTTITANAHKCAVATNAGFFQFSPKPTYCLGEVVVGGAIVEWADDGSPLVALTRNATIIGPLAKSDIAALGVMYATSGFGVIVADGAPSAAGVAQAAAAVHSQRPTAEEVAPRTIFAVDTAGRIVIVAIDGVEKLLLGVTLDEAAEIFSGGATGFPFDIAHAVNMDGGGSTTFSATPFWPFAAQVFNRPTDTDVGPISERSVTNIFCISGQ
jgi:exopolysaccharide biosynthesis protein